MFFIHTNQCPAHLGNIVTPLHNNPSRQRLRSSTGTDYLIPRTIGRSLANDHSRLLVRPPGILYQGLMTSLYAAMQALLVFTYWSAVHNIRDGVRKHSFGNHALLPRVEQL